MDTDYFSGQLSLKLYQCDAIKRDNDNLIHPNELDYVSTKCTGLGHNVVDCKDISLEHHLHDVNSLNFNTVSSTGNTTISLPYFIPIISNRLFEYNIPGSVVGITLRDLFKHYPIYNSNGGSRSLQSFNFNHDLLTQNCFHNKKVILFSSGKDCLIESIWKYQEEIDYYNVINTMGFSTATSINFSLFKGECPMAHALNLKKSLITFEQYQKSKIKSIPHLYWTNIHHLNRWIEWLNQNPDICFIAYNCQMCDEEFYSIVEGGIRYILNKIPRMHILLEGPKQNLLHRLKDISSSIHVATKSPSEKASNYRRFYYSKGKLRIIKQERNNIQNLFKINCQQYQIYLEKSFYGQIISDFSIVDNSFNKDLHKNCTAIEHT